MVEHSAGQRIRLFVAVDVPADVRAAVDEAVAPLRARLPEVRWSRADGWHLTLAFLGWVAGEQLSAVREALERGVREGPGPFMLRLTGHAGTFGTGALWAGLELSAELDALAAAVRSALAEVVDLADGDRAFSAHLTLARLPRGRRPPAAALRELAAAYAGSRAAWSVTEVVLYRSHLGASGASYETLARTSLSDLSSA